MYKLTYHVPDSHLEATKTAIFDAGAGDVDGYDHCCWQVLGRGQFRPKEGSTPFIGDVGQVQQVEEWHVEVVCRDDLIKRVVAALKQSHPYEQPAYAVFRMEPL